MVFFAMELLLAYREVAFKVAAPPFRNAADQPWCIVACL